MLSRSARAGAFQWPNSASVSRWRTALPASNLPGSTSTGPWSPIRTSVSVDVAPERARPGDHGARLAEADTEPAAVLEDIGVPVLTHGDPGQVRVVPEHAGEVLVVAEPPRARALHS